MTIAVAPHTRIDNDIIDNMAKIGVYGYAVYSAIKRHLNQATGACFPSYTTIARITGMNRSTVIEYVKKLIALKLLSPQWRYKDDGSHASNQYHFQGLENSVPSKKVDDSIQIHGQEIPGSSKKGGRPEPPQVVVESNHPSCPKPPEQVSSLNKKQRTIAEVDVMPTDKQKTCPHPPELIVILPENITICNHCYSLLDENLKLKEEKTPPPAERDAA